MMTDEETKPVATEESSLSVLPDPLFHPNIVDIWTLGIAIVAGGQYFTWNGALSAGFGSCAIAMFFVASGYLALCCCTMELAGVLPFAGGAYGLARCSLGFYAGFMVGCFEALEYITYVAISTVAFGRRITTMYPSWEGYEPVVWALFFVISLSIYTKMSRRVFYRVANVLAATSLVLLLIYCFGSLKFVDFGHYADAVGNPTPQSEHAMFEGGALAFMRVLHYPISFFIGVESLTMAAVCAKDPRRVVPRSQIACVLTLLVF